MMALHRIMFIDDEPWILLYLERVIDWAAYGFEIIGKLQSPTAAQDEILLHKPHVVFMDVNMPGITGLELIRRLKEQGSDALFVILSGYAEFEYARESIALGTFDYLLKPVEAEDITSLLERIKPVLPPLEEPVSRQEDSDKNGEYANKGFSDLIHYMNSHFDQKLTLKELADQFFLNANYCCSLFNRHIGMSFSEYLLSLRMQEAEKLLLYTNLSIKDIAARCGYEDYFYFNKTFKRQFGHPPAKYRSKRE